MILLFRAFSFFCILFYSFGDEGPADYSALDPARNPATPLYPGTTGDEVMALQNALAGVTYPIGREPDGVFDEATEMALVAFQDATAVPSSETGYVSVYTMEQFDLMLGIAACPSFGLSRISDAEVTSAISDGAVAVLDSYWNYPIGTQIPFEADGDMFIGRIELHYHPYNGSMTPYGYHHGVSVFAYDMPPMTGSEFLAFSANMSVAQREDHIMLQLAMGNIPSRILNGWRNVIASDSQHNITYNVLSDYLAIGTDSDFVRIPCAAFTAQKLADFFNASMPTTLMVDQIWAASTDKVEPQPISPSDAMCGNAYIEHENSLINDQLELIGANDSPFVGGDKKDTVLTNQYIAHPASVAEYGWHQLNGEVIQPLYLGHSADWADYSMGIRLVAISVIVDSNKEMLLQDVLADPILAPLISTEGVMTNARAPVYMQPASVCWQP